MRVEFQLKLARQILAHEFRVLANVRRDHLFDLFGLQQNADAKVVNSRVIGRKCEVFRASVFDSREQKLWNAAQAKAACRDEHAVMQQPVEGGGGIWINLFHEAPQK